MKKDTNAPGTNWLISDAKLLALHRRLVKAVTEESREEKGIDRYAAARIALWFDLKGADTVTDSAAPSIPDLLDAARRNKSRKNRQVVLTWNDRPRAEWRSALAHARRHSLPVVFVCEAMEKLSAPTRNGRLPAGHELPCIRVDGHDLVAAYRVAHEAIDRARRDRGPTLIQLATFKVGRSVFADPVADMENYLRGRGLLRMQKNGMKS